jgi:hypothetical protein
MTQEEKKEAAPEQAQAQEGALAPAPKPEPKAVKAVREVLEKCKVVVAERKKSATKDGKFNKYDPPYRRALKKTKRTQRKLHREKIRAGLAKTTRDEKKR